MCKVYLWQLQAQLGMREAKTDGLDVWLFFNALIQRIVTSFDFRESR